MPAEPVLDWHPYFEKLQPTLLGYLFLRARSELGYHDISLAGSVPRLFLWGLVFEVGVSRLNVAD